MKTSTKPLFVGLVTACVLLGALAFATGAKRHAPKPAECPPPSAPAVEPAPVYVEPTAEQRAQYLAAYGWMVGQQAGFEMGFSEDEINSIVAGIRSAAEGKDAPDNMKELFPKMQEYLGNKEDSYRKQMEAKMEEDAQVHLKEGAEFLAGVATQEGVQKTDKGLYYKIEVPGNDKHPTDQDAVTLHYTGKLIDGTVFDSSLDRDEPVDLPLFGVIEGFKDGVELLGEGGKATLYIPAALAYGNRAAGPIPPGSTLVFEVNLIKVHPAPAPGSSETPDNAEAAENTEPNAH
jgi:FKBP-type peptidyl-prolyl cis-trans isomerase